MTTEFAESQLTLFIDVSATTDKRTASPVGDTPPMRVTPKAVLRDNAKAGQALATAGAQRAIDAAGAQFEADALRFFVTYCMTAGRDVTTPEARLASKGIVSKPRDARSWGQVPIRAVKEGYIVRVGFTPSTDPRSHACPRSLWRWTGKTLT